MAKLKEKVDVYECDGCKRFCVGDVGTPALGFHGTASNVHATGATATVPWFAHDYDCILKAIENAIDKEA